MFVIKQRTGFCSYYFYGWVEKSDRFIDRRDLARKFVTRKDARSTISQIEALNSARGKFPAVPLEVEEYVR